MISDIGSLKVGDIIKYNPPNGLNLNMPNTGLSITPNSLAQITGTHPSLDQHRYVMEFKLSPHLTCCYVCDEKVVQPLFDKIEILHLHLLSIGTTRKGSGLYHPSEDIKEISQNIAFAIPVEKKQPFDLYKCWTAFHRKGNDRPEMNKAHLLKKLDAISFVLEHPDIKIHFRMSDQDIAKGPLSYLGELKHPDFQYKFVILDLIEESLINYLFNHNNNKEFIVGIPEEDYIPNSISRKELIFKK